MGRDSCHRFGAHDCRRFSVRPEKHFTLTPALSQREREMKVLFLESRPAIYRNVDAGQTVEASLEASQSRTGHLIPTSCGAGLVSITRGPQ